MKVLLVLLCMTLCLSQDLIPDLTPMKILNLGLYHNGDKETIRFTTTIVNIGDGPFEVKSRRISTDSSEAYQNIYNDFGDVSNSKRIGEFVFHPTHNHYHLDNVATYSIYQGLDDGTQGKYSQQLTTSNKVSFCMEDTIPLNPTVEGSQRFTKCNTDVQGISPGYADVYADYLPDQDLNVNDLESDTVYYLEVNVNPKRNFIEKDLDNNIAWVSFTLEGDFGERKLNIIGYSNCGEVDGLCGQYYSDPGDPTGQGYSQQSIDNNESQNADSSNTSNDQQNETNNSNDEANASSNYENLSDIFN